MKRLLSFAPKLKYILYLDVSEAMCTKLVYRISIMHGHVSLSFICENFTYNKEYPQVFSVKVTFQQVSVAETVHTPSFQIDSAYCNYLESPSFSKFQSTKTVWNLGPPRIPHCENLLKREISGLKLCGNHTYS